MPETLTLIKRGKRIGGTDESNEYEWYQTLPEGVTAEGARSLGYPVIEFVPKSELNEVYRYANEGWEWLDQALAALGARTVFQIPKAYVCDACWWFSVNDEEYSEPDKDEEDGKLYCPKCRFILAESFQPKKKEEE